MMRKAWMVLALVVAGATSPVGAGLPELAMRAEWARAVEVAVRRGEQLPLRPDEAFIAAVAAAAVGNGDAEVRFLELAAGGGPLAALARVELAQRVVSADGARALELALPELRRPPTREIRAAAAAVAMDALDSSLSSSARAELERLVSSLPRDVRRPLQVKLAVTAATHRRQRLGDVLESSARDLAALDAARALLEEGELSAEERWWVAQALYRHALYGEAQRLLDGLGDGAKAGSLPRWQVAFLAGRCAFRQGDFKAAVASYGEAVAHAGGGERAADLEVHLARALELRGRLEEAVTAAQRAVRLRATDERRLFLARLRLRSHQPEYAHLGIARLRSRAARDRGELMVALYDLAEGQHGAARRRLEAIRRRPWAAPAAVLAGEIAAGTGDWSGMLEVLGDAGSTLPPFWAEEARGLLEQAPPELIDGWRRRLVDGAAAGSERARRRRLAQWATLEIDQGTLGEVRTRIAADGGLEVAPDAPELEAGLAAELWQRGLAQQAVRWDPSGLPRRDAGQALWSAHRMLESGAPGPAIAAADAAWRMAGSEIPVRAYPEKLERALYPLPYPDLVRRAAAAHGVPWSLLAALAREESRWSPVAVSAVGARGLLQLLPETAVTVARRLGRSPPAPADLFDPALSLDLGAAEMTRLLAEYKGRWAPAVAAYNAGQAQAALWLSECGRDCSPARYVATISFAVTREYTSHVLAGAEAYERLYGSAPPAQKAEEKSR